MSSSDSSSQTRGQHFAEGFVSGVQDTFSSFGNLFRRDNYAAARRQTGQLFSAATHPQRTFSALRQAATDSADQLDVGATVARGVGEIAGGGATLLGGTLLGVRALRNPYLATRTVQGWARRYDAFTGGSTVLQNPGVRRFLLTRPLATGVGTGLGVASFVGGAQDRADTATENRQRWPDTSRTLHRANLQELTATPVSRAVRGSPSSHL